MSETNEMSTQLPITETPTISDAELGALIEAMLLVTPDAPTLDELAAGAETTTAEIERGLTWLEQRADRGWIIQRHGRRIHLATAPRFAERIRIFLGLDREARLSAASLETLALVAYQQPVTRSEIEAIRGVDSSGLLAKLHARGLIEPVARLATVGNPIQYGTTVEFLNCFGLRSLADLPPLGSIDGRDGAELLQSARDAAVTDDVTTPDDASADEA